MLSLDVSDGVSVLCAQAESPEGRTWMLVME